MGEAAAVSSPALEVSVSFGRFEIDSLSWEKWSSFSPNKYLEEVEKCAAPGSVAQKKAYFEAHYKKIAARKAELLDQEKHMESSSSTVRDQENNGGLMVKTCGEDFVFDESNIQTSSDEFWEEPRWDAEPGGDNNVGEPDVDCATNMEGQDALVAGVTEEMGSGSDSLALNQPEEAGLVKEQEVSFVESEDIKKEVVAVKEVEIPSSMASKNKEGLPKRLEKALECTPVVKEKNGKFDRGKTPQKVTPMNKVRDMASVKKKPVSPATKTPQISTQKFAKPIAPAIRTPQPCSSLSATRSSTKKVANVSLPKCQISSGGESRRVAPKSLHMSLSLDPPSAEETPPPATARKSFITEKMSDKEIVKRAFQTFQNNSNQLKSSAGERSSGAKQAPKKIVSTSRTPQEENGGSPKPCFVDKKTAKAAPSFLGMKSEDRPEKVKEFYKQLDEKSITARLQTKTKEEKEAENKNLRQIFNSRAMPMPGVYRGTKVSKGPVEKEGSKTLRI